MESEVIICARVLCSVLFRSQCHLLLTALPFLLEKGHFVVCDAEKSKLPNGQRGGM